MQGKSLMYNGVCSYSCCLLLVVWMRLGFGFYFLCFPAHYKISPLEMIRPSLLRCNTVKILKNHNSFHRVTGGSHHHHSVSHTYFVPELHFILYFCFSFFGFWVFRFLTASLSLSLSLTLAPFLVAGWMYVLYVWHKVWLAYGRVWRATWSQSVWFFFCFVFFVNDSWLYRLPIVYYTAVSFLCVCLCDSIRV